MSDTAEAIAQARKAVEPGRPKHVLRTLGHSIREYKKASILAPVFVAVEGILEILIPTIMASLIDEGITGGSMPATVKFGVILLVCAMVSLGAGFLSGKYAAVAGAGFAKNLRKDQFEKVQGFSFTNIDRFSTGSIVTRLTTDVTNLQNAYMMIIRLGVRAPIMVVVAWLFSFRISPSISLVFLACIPILAIGLCGLVVLVHPVFERVFHTYDALNNVVDENLQGIRVVKSYNRESFEVSKFGRYFVKQQWIGDVNAFVEESVNGQKVIKVFNHEDATQKTFDEKNEELFEASAEANTWGNVTMPVVGNMGYLLYILLAIVGAAVSLAGVNDIGLTGVKPLTLGTLVSLLTLSRSFINPIGQVSQQLTMVMMALAGASRIFKLMDEPIEEDKGTVTLVNVELGEDGRTMTEVDHETGHWAWKREVGDDGTRSLKAAEKLKGSAREVAMKAKEQAITSPDGRLTLLRGDVRFTNVTFGYNPDKPVLHDITWFAKPGQKIALVGATGAGKTTVTNLINRFYDIQHGQILYDGISVAGIKKPDLRRSLGIVLQDVNLFTGTVMDNIRYGRLNATDEECIEAARLVNADSFIRMLSKGYDTVLEGDGSGLSQGQRQLISIARAAVADPPALILDEATSSIDTRTEEVVQAGMDNLMKGRTVFVIAHRLSTVRNSDVIMVLDHGNIIERGSHDELIAQKGEYYQLYTGAVELE